MEVAVTMPSSSNILERLRWKVALGLVIVAAGFAASAAPSADVSLRPGSLELGLLRSAESDDAAVDVARSSWGFSRSTASDDDAVEVARTASRARAGTTPPRVDADA